jgi:hypothetical protein
LLPALKDLIANNPELSETIVPQVYSEANILLSQASQAYLHEERAFVRAYNKTKHGFVVINDKHIFQADPSKINQKRSWIVSDVPKYDPAKDPNSSMVELFSVELKDVDPMIERIGVIRGAVVALCDITLYLLEQEVITTV